ncbi:tetratricopeptide repeat protein [Paenibacillus sp. B1-33]|uniref:tetratricopeptide repeat protein n=1 Tax=unclassified Paenibacillus TaxID=185978 RepID=UPI003D2B3710
MAKRNQSKQKMKRGFSKITVQYLNSIKDRYMNISKKKYFKITMNAFTIFFAIIGFLSSIATLDSYINDDRKAESLFLKAKDYYNDKDYDKASKAAQKAFNINPNIENLKYYYTLSLLKSNDPNRFEAAKDVYMGNVLNSNASELAILGYIYHNDGEYHKVLETFDKIDDPLHVNKEIYPIYVKSWVDSTYKTLSYEEAKNRVNKYMIQINRKYNSEKTSMSDGMKFLYVEKKGVEIHFKDIFDFDLEPINYSNLILNNIAFNYAMENQDSVNLDNIIANGAQGFDVFNYQEIDLNKDFLFQFNSYITSYSGFTETHLSNIKFTFDKTIDALKRAQNSIEYQYKDELQLLYLLNNIFVSNNNLDWEKYDIQLLEDKKINILLPKKIEDYRLEGEIFEGIAVNYKGISNTGVFKDWYIYEIGIEKGKYRSSDNFTFRDVDNNMVPLFFVREF